MIGAVILKVPVKRREPSLMMEKQVNFDKTPEQKAADGQPKLAGSDTPQQDYGRRLAMREARRGRSAEAAQAAEVAKAERRVQEELPGIARAVNQVASALNTGSGGTVPVRDNVEKAKEVPLGDQDFPRIIGTRGGGVFLLDLGHGQGQICDTKAGKIWPSQKIISIVARGYWEVCDNVDAADVLSLVKPIVRAPRARD